MNEREMGRALLRFDASLMAPADPRADAQRQVERVLARDRRRVRGLTVVTVLAWLATVAMVVAVISVGYVCVYPSSRSCSRMPVRRAACARTCTSRRA